MDIFETIGRSMERAMGSLSDAGAKMRHEARQATDHSKIRLKQIELKSKLKTQYENLGRTTYARRIHGKVELSEEDLCRQIADLEEQLRGLDNLLRTRQFKMPKDPGTLRCEYCGEKLNTLTKPCPSCGLDPRHGAHYEGMQFGDVEVLTKQCPNCHNQLPIHAKYCNRCGFQMEDF